MSSLSQKIAKFVIETKFEDLPGEVVHEAKRSLLDSIGCAIAGTTTDIGRISIGLAKRLGGSPESLIIGSGDKVSCCNAAFANGELIYALDYDPIYHIQPFVIPPSLAMSESTKASGKDLILATVLAQEISKRFSLALTTLPSMMVKLKGELKTPDVLGVGNECIFGATAGVGKILRLNHKEMTHALGIAGYLCPVPSNRDWADTLSKPMVKYAPAGWLCSAAITAALLAERGFTGNDRIFDSNYGFWKFYASERWEPDVILDKMGEKWLFTDITYKPYPCCRFLHCQLDCFISIIEKNNLVPEDIEKVTVFGLPEFASRQPMEVKNQVDAQFSLPYALAAAAYRVKIGADWQDWKTIRDLQIREFMKRVSFQVHPESIEAKRKDPRTSLAKVEVLGKGKTFREERMYAKGTPFMEFKTTDGELVEKFRDNASKILPAKQIDKAISSLLKLETLKNITHLIEQIIP